MVTNRKREGVSDKIGVGELEVQFTMHRVSKIQRYVTQCREYS